ncbi:MAG: M24 family metallopeptidase [Ignavibacteriales bacterium]
MLLNKSRALEVMRRNQVDAIVATSPENVTYVSGYWSFSQRVIKSTQVYAIIPADAQAAAVLVAPIGDLDGMADKGPGIPVEPYGTFHVFNDDSGEKRGEYDRYRRLLQGNRADSPASALAAALKRLGLSGGRIAVDSSGLTPVALQDIRAALTGYTICEGWGLLRQIRMVKTPEEISRVKKSTSVTEQAVTDVLASLREGMTEMEMFTLFNESIILQGGMPLLTCIGVGSRSSLPNVQPSNHRLKKDDVIRFDVGCVYDSYCSDIARIACFGRPSEKAARYHRAVLEGEQKALAQVRPGTTAAGVFETAVEATRAGGIPHFERHHCGHGIGIECYDMPSIAPQDRTVLERGMVINVETCYYELGFAGLQAEDTVVVTEDGFEYLSVSDRSLRVI